MNETFDEENFESAKKIQKNVWLTTSDNPFNCFDDFEKWFNWDKNHGYNLCKWIMNLARVSETFSEEDNAAEVERVCRNLLFLNPFGNFVLVTREL